MGLYKNITQAIENQVKRMWNMRCKLGLYREHIFKPLQQDWSLVLCYCAPQSMTCGWLRPVSYLDMLPKPSSIALGFTKLRSPVAFLALVSMGKLAS